MRRTPVESSSLASVGYDPQQQTLEVEFVRGAVYQYDGVPPEVYQELLVAPSIGAYFDAMIKQGEYNYRRIR